MNFVKLQVEVKYYKKEQLKSKNKYEKRIQHLENELEESHENLKYAFEKMESDLLWYQDKQGPLPNPNDKVLVN